MTVGSKEFYDILTAFECIFSHIDVTREKNIDLWRMGQVYENGETNKIYDAYRHGYAQGRLVYM